MSRDRLNPPVNIDHAIMHRVDSKKNELILVGEEISLTPPVRELFCQLLEVSASSAETQALDPSGQSPALLACRSLIGDPSRFVELSQRLAEQLYAAMATNILIAPGDLMVVMGHDASGPLVALAKTEPNTEFRVEYKKRRSGVSYVDITPTDAIAPSKDKPPQKCAFVRDTPFDNGTDVFLVDYQSGYNDNGVAKFFYSSFLGCEMVATAAAQTMKFCRAVEQWRWTNAKYLARYLPDQGIMRFTRTLHAHLQLPTVNFEAFAHVALEDVDNNFLSPRIFASFLATKVYDGTTLPHPTPTSFDPDPAVAHKLIASIHLSLLGGIQLTGPTDEILKRMELAEDHGQLVLRLSSPSMKRTFQKPKQ